MKLENTLTRQLGIQYPIICGAMYPCSNPELVAAVSEAGGIGIIQPLSLTYVYRYDYRKGLEFIRSLTKKPLGVNLLIEGSSKIYMDRMKAFLDQSLEAGIRLFVTALGNPRWVVDRVHAAGGIVYHDVTERKWGLKARDAGVDGLICVNSVAGGHAGTRTPEALFAELADLGLPLVCAGGVGDEKTFIQMIALGYLGVQMGTRFIASRECRAGADYKDAILKAEADDVVLTERLTGVPVAVIKTRWVEKVGTKAGPIGRRMLRHPRFKHWARMFYSLRSFRDLKRGLGKSAAYNTYYQAGKSVAGIESIDGAADIVVRFANAALAAPNVVR